MAHDSKIIQFDLTSSLFLNGVRSSDIKEYEPGLHVPVFCLSDFPKEESARSLALWLAIKDSFERSGHDKHYVVTKDQCDHLAQQTFSYVTSPQRVFVSNNWTLPRGHFQNVQALGLDELDRRHLYRWTMNGQQYERHLVFPEPLEYADLPREQLPVFKIETYPVILTEPMSQPPIIAWQKHTWLPDHLLQNYPRENLAPLLDAAHESRHVVQLKAHDPDTEIFRYCTELDADLSARHTFRKAGIGAETLKAHGHARYMDVLHASEAYWFAPAMEALETGKPVPHFAEVCQSVTTIRSHLLAASARDRTLPLDVRNGAAEGDWAAFQTYAFREQPTFGYRLLDELTRKGHLGGRGLTCHIADRVLQGVQYFAPTILKNQSLTVFQRPLSGPTGVISPSLRLSAPVLAPSS